MNSKFLFPIHPGQMFFNPALLTESCLCMTHTQCQYKEDDQVVRRGDILVSLLASEFICILIIIIIIIIIIIMCVIACVCLPVLVGLWTVLGVGAGIAGRV